MTDVDPLAEFDQVDDSEELRRIVADLQRRLRRAKAKTADLVAAVESGARDAALVLGKPAPVAAPKRDARRTKPEVCLVHCSDWHFGKRTSSFDSAVARARVDMLAQKVGRLATIERADHPVRDCHLLFGGDFVENVGIFPGQPFEIDSSLFSQMFAAVDAGATLILSMLEGFEHLEVWEEPGNHGRLGRKGDHPAEDNADMLVYRLIRERVGRQPRLVWHEREGWHTIVEIGAYRALFVHGHQIKSFGGNIPAFGITKKVNAWATGVVDPFTDCYMGHFHQPLSLPIAHGRGRTFVNPSIESDSVFAKEFVGSTGTPGQRVHFIEPDKGRVTSERIVWLDQ